MTIATPDETNRRHTAPLAPPALACALLAAALLLPVSPSAAQDAMAQSETAAQSDTAAQDDTAQSEMAQPEGTAAENAMAEDPMAGEGESAQAAAPAPMPRDCHGAENGQFDFWVGDWNVYEWGKEDNGEEPAHNVVTKFYEGCTVREEYTTPGGYSGTSLNFYDRFDGHWHQTWIDSSGTPLYLVGGLEDGKMVLSDDPQDARPRSRITWAAQPDGSVRQTWELSRDQGATWEVVFDGRYVRAGG